MQRADFLFCHRALWKTVISRFCCFESLLKRKLRGYGNLACSMPLRNFLALWSGQAGFCSGGLPEKILKNGKVQDKESNMGHRNHGEIQAQGPDIGGRGYRETWGSPQPPTKSEGLGLLGKVESQCSERQRAARERGWKQAQTFIERAPSEGYPTTSRSFPRNGGIRVDIEIWGLAFSDK